MTIMEYFNIDNPEHQDAYLHLLTTGVWPESFAMNWPRDLVFPTLWNALIAEILAEKYIKEIVARRKK